MFGLGRKGTSKRATVRRILVLGCVLACLGYHRIRSESASSLRNQASDHRGRRPAIHARLLWRGTFP